MNTSFQIFPLGDAAATLDLGNLINPAHNNKVIAMRRWLLQQPFEGLKDVVVAYSSLTVYYDPFIIHKFLNSHQLVFEWVKKRLEEAWLLSGEEPDTVPEPVRIPVCYDYEFAPDLQRLAEEKQLSAEAFVHLHINNIYRVYMIGFMPGFPYMGELDARLSTPRKKKPEPVVAGSVGIAGNQTGIYPFSSPGGWHIIGRTPVSLFHPGAERSVLLESGNRVQFYPISRAAFENYQAIPHV